MESKLLYIKCIGKEHTWAFRLRNSMNSSESELLYIKCIAKEHTCAFRLRNSMNSMEFEFALCQIHLEGAHLCVFLREFKEFQGV